MCNNLKDNPLENLYNFFSNQTKQFSKNDIKKIIEKAKDKFCLGCVNREYVEVCRDSIKRIILFIKDCNNKNFYGFLESRESRLIAYLDMSLVDKISFGILYEIILVY